MSLPLRIALYAFHITNSRDAVAFHNKTAFVPHLIDGQAQLGNGAFAALLLKLGSKIMNFEVEPFNKR